MIIFLREKFIAQIFMWVIAIVFVIGSIMLYSGSSGGRGDGTEAEVVLKIDALEVTRGDFERMVSDQMRSQQNQRFGAPPDQKQTEKDIIDFLIKRAIEGSANISNAEVERYIRSDATRVQQYNQYEGFGAAELYKQSVRYQLSSTALRDNVQNLELVTDTEAEQDYRLEADKAKVKYIEFRHSDYVSTDNVTDEEDEEGEEAETYFQENKDDYKTEEQVNVKFININPEDFVTQSDIEAYYTENQAEFTTPEVVKARHILKQFPEGTRNPTDEQRTETKAAAEKLLKTVKDELAAGTSFADLAKTHSDGPSGADGGALGSSIPELPPGKYFGRGQMVKPFEEACFDILEPGEISDLVETVFGYHIIQLEEKHSPVLKSFPEVESEIRDKVVKSSGVDNAKRTAEDLLFDIEVEDYETAIGLDRYKELSLAVGETDFFSKDETNIPNIGSSWTYGGLIQELFDMEVGVTDTIETKRFGRDVTAYFVATVLGKKPAAIPEFDDVKEQVINDLREKKAKESAFADAQNLFNQRADSESLDDLIKKYKVSEEETAVQKSVQESSLFNRTVGSSYISNMGNSKEVMFAAFNMSVGDVRGPFKGDSSVYIVELVERVEPDLELYQTDPAQKAQRFQTLLQDKKQSAYDNWFAARKKVANIWIHEDYR
ncbi:MAG: peptidyl-prolyl cis-trans isomerase [Candidatus Poribacteria bacterium]|nr:peptidyl-prolyl cis-trans isomerase [Candidatus Poribacteria bacterium]